MGAVRDSVNIRDATPEDAAAIARVSVDTWRATYRGIFPDDVLAGLSYERRAALGREILEDTGRRHVYLVAETGAEIVGFIHGGPERTGEHPYDGEVYAVYVLPAWQGHGFGARLVREATRRLVQDGNRSLMLWVATANHPSRTFYERLGGRVIAEREEDFGAVTVAETAYGWPDAEDLFRD